MERLTRQRQAVVDALARSGQALSPQELLERAKTAVPSLNLSTVYRQIKGLQDAGDIVRVELPGQPPRFEVAASANVRADAVHHDDSHAARHHLHASPADAIPEHHHHFHCTACDRVFPIHACPGPMNDLAPPGFEVQRHDLTLRGRCASCVNGASA
ncbi:MAG: transcriptional repressor [Burkholderiaceae bacterium]|nr:transcriptional repressor [Burkholderiaceae bacterium]